MPAPENGGAWGILGGSFDPVHLGHLNLSSEIRSEAGLDGVLLVPAFRHPLKEACHASFEQRVEMLTLAAAGCDYLVVSEIEKEHGLPGYTLSTVRALKKAFPTVVFSFLIGEDNLAELNRWHKPDEILAEVPVLVGVRPPGNFTEGANHRWSDRVRMIETSPLEASSTRVRELTGKGAPSGQLQRLIPEPVRQYIATKGLYQ